MITFKIDIESKMRMQWIWHIFWPIHKTIRRAIFGPMEEYSSSTSSHSILEECVERCIQNSNRFSNQNDQDKLIWSSNFVLFFLHTRQWSEQDERKKKRKRYTIGRSIEVLPTSVELFYLWLFAFEKGQRKNPKEKDLSYHSISI